MRTAPSAPGVERRREAVAHAHELQRAAAEVEHGAVAQRRRVDRREVAVARLLLAREDADRQAAAPRAPARGSRREFVASRIALVATTSISAALRPAASQKCAKTSIVAHRARHALLAERAGLVDARADPHRLVDLVGALPPAAELAGRPRGSRRRRGGRSWTRGRRPPRRSGTFDELDPVAVRVAHEAQPRAVLAHRVRRLLGLDALLAQARRASRRGRRRHRDVVVAGAQLVGVDAEVVGQLQPRRRRRAGP